jgi:hypothetical protein
LIYRFRHGRVLLDPQDLALLGFEIVGADHTLVAKLGELLQLGGVVGRSRGRGSSGLGRCLLGVPALVLFGPALLLAAVNPAGNAGRNTGSSGRSN